jgi:hypothetical protein
MTTLAEIEAAADRLSVEQKGELFLYLATRLQTEPEQMPEPRTFSAEQIAGWIADDEADFKLLGKLP